MSDLISRQVAIKAIEDLKDCYNGFSDTYDKACIIGVLEELPSAQPEQPWISCSERLPEENIKVLVTDEDGCIDVAYYYYNEWSEDPKIEWWTGGFRVYPIAWMPLPEPYKDFSEHMNEPEEE